MNKSFYLCNYKLVQIKMTLEQQVHQNDVKLRKAEERIKRLEEIVAKLVVRETNKEREAETQIEFEMLRDEASSQIGHDM